LVENKKTSVFVLEENESGTFNVKPVNGETDLDQYATKDYVQELIDGIEMPEGTAGMVALTEQEILDICK
jgi:hypothetical protein